MFGSLVELSVLVVFLAFGFSNRGIAAPLDALAIVETCYVDTCGDGSRNKGFGAGFFVSSDGLLATAYHVIKGAHSVRVWDGKRRVQGEGILKPGARDFDVLPIETTGFHGTSGGALVASGKAVGLLSGGMQEGGGFFWAIPAKYILEAKNSSGDRPWPSAESWPRCFV
jgi:hypothetical protein